jgi:hypothetical protein
MSAGDAAPARAVYARFAIDVQAYSGTACQLAVRERLRDAILGRDALAISSLNT